MPSRRKSAHTTKIERVPRYEAYHGEEDIDGDGTLDLSMKRIKVEPLDLEQGGNKVASSSLSTTVTEGDPIQQEEIEEMVVVGESSGGSEAGVSAEEVEGSSATSSGEISQSNSDAKSAADDAPPGSDGSDSRDHVTSQVNALGSIVCATPDHPQFVIDANGKALNASRALSLFSQSSKGKSMRPFKLYTSSRDLLSGLAQQSGTPSLAAYSVPIALAQVAGAPGTVPLAFASPTVTGVPMIPITAQSSTTAASSTAAAMGAGTATTSTASTSSANTNATKSTSSTTEVHLMTLATEADKILRERHASGESDAFSADSNSADSMSNDEAVEQALIAGEEGTVLKIPSLVSKASNGNGEDSLTLIQKRAVAAAVAAANPQKSKKRRQALPEDLKDNAYWERRRKNNEAAKRSRDARRAKEDQIAIRAALLEQENIRLKIEVTALKEETARLRAKLYGNNNC